MERNSFVFYGDWWNVLAELPEKEYTRVSKAIFMYAFSGAVPDDPMVRAITGLMRSAIDRDLEKWQSIREKRIEAGREGGKAKAKQKVANGSKAKHTLANQAVNVNVNVNDNVINKESKPKKDELSLPPHSTQKFVQYNQWIETNCPHLLKMEQMTEKELDTLLLNYQSEDIFNTLRKMENYRDTAKKNRSVYRTLRNWLNRDNNKKGGVQ